MSKGTIAVAALSVFLCALLVFATAELRRISASVGGLQDRVARLEPAVGSTTHADLPKADGTTSSIPTPHGIALSDEDRILAEIAALREELNRIGRTLHGSGPGKAIATDDVSKAFQDALAAKEKSDLEKKLKLAQKQEVAWAKAVVDTLVKPLGLTEQQKLKMADILADYGFRMDGDSTGLEVLDEAEQEAENLRLTNLEEEKIAKLKAMLTAEQFEKYDEIMKKDGLDTLMEIEEAESDGTAK